MRSKVRRVIEDLGTPLALEGHLASVKEQVPLQVVNPLELLATLVAPVRTLAGVDEQVALKFVGIRKPFGTLGAA